MVPADRAVRVAAKPYWSADSETEIGSSICSGAMKWGVPSTVRVMVSRLSVSG